MYFNYHISEPRTSYYARKYENVQGVKETFQQDQAVILKGLLLAKSGTI